jgi:hypothetical protein
MRNRTPDNPTTRRPGTADAGEARRGQAMIEFLVGIIAVMALFAGLIQFVSLFTAQTDTFSKARRAAGGRAMADVQMVSAADYIQFWDAAADQRRYSVDDTHSDANAISFKDEIVSRSAPNATDWLLLDTIPNNEMRDLRDNAAPATLFGLMEGQETADIPLLPVVRTLLYDRSNIEIKSSVWMPWCREVY